MIRKLLWAWLVIGTLLMIATVAYGGEPRVPYYDMLYGWPPPSYLNHDPLSPEERAKVVKEWEFSPAGPHHAAIVRVQAGENAGSGVYVAMGGRGGVLTAAHVVQPSHEATVFWSDGTQSQGETRCDKYQHDVGVVLVIHPTTQPLTLADADPTPGSRVEFVTRGGPDNDRLRSFWSAFEGERQLVGGSDSLYSVAVSPGDSGGAILDSSHRVVGIVSAGRTSSVNGDGWPVYRGSVSAPCAAIRAFVGRVFCPPGGCPPNQGRRLEWQRGGQIEFPRGRGIEWERGGRIEFYPPRQQPPPVLPGPGPMPPDEPPTDPPPNSQNPSATPNDSQLAAINARLDALATAIAAIPAGRTGDTGQQGAKGADGKPGPKGDKGEPGVFDPSKLTDAQLAALAARLPPIHVEVEMLDSPPVNPQLKQDVYLGGTLPLRLYLNPPKKVESATDGGHTNPKRRSN